MKQRFILGLIILAPSLLLLWIFHHGYVVVAVEDSEAHIQVLDQGSRRSIIGKNTSSAFKKLVRRGGQEISVDTDNGTFHAVVQVRGFLRTTTVTTAPKPLNKQTFIGDNPSGCMYEVSMRLISGNCGTTFDKLRVHAITSNSIPVVSSPASKLFGLVEGVIKTSEGSLILLRSAVLEGMNQAHVIYTLSPDGTASGGTILKTLDKNKIYSIKSFNDGFVVYAVDGSEAYEYSSIGAEPLTIKFNKPKNKQLKFSNIIVSKNQIAAIYTDSPERVENEHSDPEGYRTHSEELEEEIRINEKPVSEVIVYSHGKKLDHYDFATSSDSIRFCGDKTLCTLNQGVVKVFNVSGSKAKYLYQIVDVAHIESTSEGFLMIGDGVVRSFNTSSRTGYTSISLKDFQFCGISVSHDRFIVCGLSYLNKSSAILVDQTNSDSDPITGRIGEVMKSGDIKSLSVYRNTISITPYVGKAEFNPETGLIEYSQKRISEANQRINKLVDKVGIDRSEFNVVFTIK